MALISPSVNHAVVGDNGSGQAVDCDSACTIPGLAVVSGPLNFSGNINAPAWTTNGLRLTSTAATLTDTTSSGTVAAAYTNVLGGNTIAASIATTFTNYYNTYIKAPVAGTNVTMTNNWALGADSFNVAGLAQSVTGKYTGQLTDSSTSTASTPATLLSGAWFTSGSGTTTKPHLLVECNSGTTTSTAWSTAGTGLGVNACTGFTGNLLDLQLNGVSKLKVDSTGLVTAIGTIAGPQVQVGSSGYYTWNGHGFLYQSVDGVSTWYNNALTGYTRMQLGGTTSGFGAIGVTNQTNPIILIRDATGGNTATIDLGIGAAFSTVAGSMTYKAGSNARVGNGTLVGGTLAVTNTSVTANSQVFLQDTTSGALTNVGSLVVSSQTAGTGFTVTSSNVLDTSTFRYWIFETN